MSIKTIILILTTTMMMNGCKGQPATPVVRTATQANRFYTGDTRELSEEVDSLLACYINRLSDYLFVLSRHLVLSQGAEESVFR